MAKYVVGISYSGGDEFEVEADSKEDAISQAFVYVDGSGVDEYVEYVECLDDEDEEE